MELEVPTTTAVSTQKEESAITHIAKSKEIEAENIIGEKTFVKTENYDSDLIDSILRGKKFISEELWEKNLFIQARVLTVTKEFVECECLIDKENLVFENRGFPKFLFDDIKNLKTKPFVILNIKSKVGSIRINILDGEKTVDKKFFTLKDRFEKLDDSGFEKPLDKPIKL